MAASKTYEMGFALQARVDGQFGSAFKAAGSAISGVAQQIQALNKTGAQITAFQNTQNSIRQTEAKLEGYRQKLQILNDEMEKNGSLTTQQATKMVDYQTNINLAEGKLESEKQKLDTLGASLQKAGVDTSNLGAAKAQLSQQLDQASAAMAKEADSAVSASSSVEQLNEANQSAADSIEELAAAAGLMTALQKGYQFMQSCANSAIQFESSMAAVKRTVGGDDSFLSSLGESFKDLSTEIPITQSELAGIATTAGQLGVAQDKVKQFSVTMAQLATTTDLSADNAATMSAQFANITGLTDYERFGSVVAELGDATATTASKVLEMGQGMAASASQAGMSATDILAIAASVGSLGIEAASGSTSMSTLISTLNKSVETGDKLQDFASVAGMTSDQFKRAWGENAVEAMNSFIQGLNDVERNGKSATVILDELGITNVRQVKAILGLASAGDLLSNTIAQSNRAWNENTALTDKASVMYSTTESKMTMMQNALGNLQIAIGDSLTPMLSSGAEALTNLLDPITSFIEQSPELVQVISTIGASVGGMLGLLTAKGAAVKMFGSLMGLIGSSAGPWLLGAAAVGAVAGGIISLVNAANNADDSFENLNAKLGDLNAQIAEQKELQNMIDQYHDLSKEVSSLDIVITPEIKESVELTADDFVGDTTVKLTAEKANELAALDFIPKGTTIKLTPEQADFLEAQGFIVGGTEIELTPEIAYTLNQNDMLEGSVVTLTPEAAAEHLKVDKLLEGESATVALSAVAGQTVDVASLVTGSETKVSIDAEINKTNVTPEDLELVQRMANEITDAKAELKQYVEVTWNRELTDDDIGRLHTAFNNAKIDGNVNSELNQAIHVIGDLPYLSSGKQKELKEFADNVQTKEGKLSETLAVLGYESVEQMQQAYAASQNLENVSGETYSFTIAADATALDVAMQQLAQMQEQADAIASQMSENSQKITEGQSELEALEAKRAELQESISSARGKKEKSALQEQLEDTNTAIDDQKTKLGELEAAQTILSEKYAAVSSAASELTAKTSELQAAQNSLRDASGGIITATNEQSEAYERQLQALENISKARESELKEQVYEAVTKQSKNYLSVVQKLADAESNVNKTADATVLMEQFAAAADPAQAYLNYVNQSIERVKVLASESGSESFFMGLSGLQDIDNAELQGILATMQALRVAMTGMEGSQYSVRDLEDYFSRLDVNLDTVMDGWRNLNSVQSENGENLTELQQKHDDFINTIVSGVQSGAFSLELLETLLGNSLSDTENGAETVAQIMEEVQAKIEAAKAAEEGFGEGVTGAAADMSNAVSEILVEIQELTDAYNEAYEAALKSLDGQFSLFEQWNQKDFKPSSLSDMQAALDSQIAYFNNYQANLEAVADKGINQDLLGSLSDGSAESMAYLAALASASDEQIASINKSFESVTQAKESLAGTMADMETNYSASMDQMQSKLDETIEAMNKSDEAAQAGAEIVQAFVDAASGAVERVDAAYGKLAEAAANALNRSISFHGISFPGFATGTEDAPRGLAVVGENGPELVNFNGGEQVINAQDTEALVRRTEAAQRAELTAQPINATPADISSGNHYDVSLQPTFNITAENQSTEDLQSTMQGIVDNLRDMVEQTIQDIENDNRRRRYSA